MTLFDVKCDKCEHIWEVPKKWEDPAPECPVCGSNFTRTIMPLMRKREVAKDPYDYLHGRIPDAKPTKSFAKDRRKGGKDTT